METQFAQLPFMVAFFLGIVAMGLSVYDIHARQLGTLDVGPWGAKRSALVEPTRDGAAHVLLAKLMKLFGNEKGEIAADLLVPVAGINALKQRGLALFEAMKATRAKASDAALTDEQRTQARADFARLEALHETNAADIKAEERVRDLERNYQPARPAADADGQAAAAAAARAGVQVKERFEDDPKRGFKNHTDQLSAIMKAGQTGIVDNRLKPLAAAGSDEQSGHTDPYGGFLLAPAFAPGILSVPAEIDPTAGRVTALPMQNSRIIINARVDKNHTSSVSGGLTVARVPAAKAATTSRQEFEQVELVAHDLVGAAFATSRILKESPASFMALMQAGFGDEFAAKKLDERLNGSGAGEFQGVINADCTIVVSKEQAQTADTILFENVNKMAARCWRYGSSIWLVNHDALPQVTTLYMPIGTGGERVPIYAPGNEDAPFGTLLGRPIFPTEFCRTVGDKGDIVLGNWSQYLEGNFGGVEEARSIHVRFLEREECFLFVEMNDAKPWWRSALTPKYSTTTLSPFVVLQAR